ncbi:hypothetical protein SAMN05421676_105135 [Salinibacillus kushneri]|uniref:Uncharacterized protein n=1 Tax=Salinibacillus kushneri TaxID=237682 RepID=A0A1I0EZL8_9BACI|nr:hypothetical protein SAMN05421676_105135 [Salinibacillus kushneri]
MNYNTLLLLVASYLLAFSLNFMPSIKHPDLNLNIFHLMFTILFIAILILYSKKGIRTLRIFTLTGVISGVLIFMITAFEHTMRNHIILEGISSIQYPFYFIFTTPVFGGNLLFDLNYGTYSLLTSLIYGAVLGLDIYFERKYAT